SKGGWIRRTHAVAAALTGREEPAPTGTAGRTGLAPGGWRGGGGGRGSGPSLWHVGDGTRVRVGALGGGGGPRGCTRRTCALLPLAGRAGRCRVARAGSGRVVPAAGARARQLASGAALATRPGGSCRARGGTETGPGAGVVLGAARLPCGRAALAGGGARARARGRGGGGPSRALPRAGVCGCAQYVARRVRAGADGAGGGAGAGGAARGPDSSGDGSDVSGGLCDPRRSDEGGRPPTPAGT